jgi:glutamyl-tRNA(Gln) amidotransferase subunit E
MPSAPEFDPTGQILNLDYPALGLKCGLEVHYQLATQQKLFCHCPVGRYSEAVDAEVLRHMRPTLSEMGEYDPCALMEYKTRKEIVYLLNKDSACTYETDDTPPFPMNPEAIDYAVEIAMLLGCTVVDELHIARKQYLDGSIPTGFQRTTLLGIDGRLPYRGREIGIHQIALEEDSCREVKDQGHMIWFRTDRLGTPMVEIITRPQMHHPFEVAEVSRLIAQTLQLFGKVRRGIGTVRQDINVSIHGGTRVEIKGVPRIPLIPRLISFEVYRQIKLLEIRDWLRRRNITDSSLEFTVSELPRSSIYFRTPRLAQALEQGQRLAAVRIAGITGLMAKRTQPGHCFAHEIAGRVRVIACLDESPNFYHTDQDGDFSLYPEEQTFVKALTGAGENDVVMVFAGPPLDITTAIEEAIARIREAAIGTPAETRQFRQGGGTDFERLLAGPHQMYPDTDSPPSVVPRHRVREIGARLPEPPWTRRERLLQAGLSEFLAAQLLASPYYDLFWQIQSDVELPPNRVSRVFVQDVTAARRAGGHPDRIADDAWLKLFLHLHQQKLNWEAIPSLVHLRSRRPGAEWLTLAAKHHLLPLAESDWKPLIDSLLPRSSTIKKPEARLRWILGQLQNPPGRVPVQRVIVYVKEGGAQP